MSQFDFDSAQKLHVNDACFDGVEDLPEEYQKVVRDSFEKGEILAAPEPEPSATKPKATTSKGKGKGKKQANSEIETDVAKPKRKGKKRVSDEMDDEDSASEPEYVPKRTRSRATKIEEE
tara:strand:- start:10347 stop:10706 length:360 start_codon:yes stop_codon:yes gene_type:complete